MIGGITHFERGGHISFYSTQTLKYIASMYKLNYFNLNNFHIFTEKNNISNFKLKILKLNKFGLYKLISLNQKSKTWNDYQSIKNRSEK